MLQGYVSFISEGWGGRASDKCVESKSGLIKKLLQSDIVLADPGFNIDEPIQELLRFLYSTTKKCSVKEIDSTRSIVNVRFHVKRLIGNLRQKYTMS